MVLCHRRSLFLILSLSSLLAAGCAEKRDGGGGPIRTDAGTRDSGPPIGPSFGVRVIDGRAGTPLIGATVALDVPGQARVEMTTGPDGRAVFPGVNPATTTPTVTAHVPGRRLLSFANVNAEYRAALQAGMLEVDGELVMPLYERADTPTLVGLSGNATNMMDPADNLSVFVNARAGVDSHMVGTAWMVTVPSGEPFSLVALEWIDGMDMTLSPRGRFFDTKGWLIVESPGVTAPGTLPLDFSMAAATMMLMGSFPIPPASRGDFFANATPQVSVVERESRALHGIARRIDVVADGMEATYEVEYVPLAGTMQADTVYALNRPPLSSVVIERGLPRDDHTPEFATPPDVTEPAFGVPHPLFSPIEVTVRDESLPVVLAITDIEAEATAWTIGFPPGTTTMTVPALPSSAMIASDVGSGELDGRAFTCEPDPVQLLGCQRSATSRAFQLVA